MKKRNVMSFIEEQMKQVFDTNIIDFAVENGFEIDTKSKKSDRNITLTYQKNMTKKNRLIEIL